MTVFFSWCTLLPYCLDFGIAVFRILGFAFTHGCLCLRLGFVFCVWVCLDSAALILDFVSFALGFRANALGRFVFFLWI